MEILGQKEYSSLRLKASKKPTAVPKRYFWLAVWVRNFVGRLGKKKENETGEKKKRKRETRNEKRETRNEKRKRERKRETRHEKQETKEFYLYKGCLAHLKSST